MKRRQFLASALICAVNGGVALAGADFEEYSRDLYDNALASGEPFLLDFYASW